MKFLFEFNPRWHDAQMNQTILPSRPGCTAQLVPPSGFASSPGRILWLLWFAICLAFVAFPVHAQSRAAPLNVPATLRSESNLPAPGGTVTVAFHFKPKAGWHGYWENPGDAGFGMQLDWNLPKGVTAGKPRYPVPEPLVISGLMNHVFEHDYTVLIDLSLDANLRVGSTLPIRVRADWLSCTNAICVPEGDNMAIDLKVGDGAVNATDRKRFDAWRALLPVPMDMKARYAINNGTIDIAIPFARGASVEEPYFFAGTEKLFRYAAPQSVRRTGDWLVVTTAVEVPFGQPINGVLRTGKQQGLIVQAIPGKVPLGGMTLRTRGNIADPSPASGSSGTSLLLTLAAAILGGLILNLMPCVFPILGLKALALAKAGGDERSARAEALAYSAGVISSCIALGAALLALRAAGEQVGWAFQLQEPFIVLLLVVLMVAVTANMVGLFEIGSINAGDKLARKDGLSGSFWTGVLAAVVATPCTGPFMAAALGAALLLPIGSALLLFAGLGFGLALPFLAIAFVPALRRQLPRPGPWLGTFRKVMAVPMGLTALALIWLLWRLSGATGLALGIVVALLVVAVCMVFGKLHGRSARFALPLVFVCTVGAAGALMLPREPARLSTETDMLGSEEFTPDRLAELRSAGEPVFVYFTADWCVTCKVNEAAAINRTETARAFADNGIKSLRADFTRRDAKIARFLASHGRSGVPLYLYYPRGRQALVLPQILSMDSLTNLR
ncbi:MAG: protein-disulfide reductase DsbD domain-containing protein [Sphingorhabdus sp.]